jgi:hypothetical protein
VVQARSASSFISLPSSSPWLGRAGSAGLAFNFYFNGEGANPVIANVLFAILHRPSSLTSEKKLT